MLDIEELREGEQHAFDDFGGRGEVMAFWKLAEPLTDISSQARRQGCSHIGGGRRPSEGSAKFVAAPEAFGYGSKPRCRALNSICGRSLM